MKDINLYEWRLIPPAPLHAKTNWVLPPLPKAERSYFKNNTTPFQFIGSNVTAINTYNHGKIKFNLR